MTAPALFEGAINGEMFLAYIQQNLAPTLPQGDVVIMDNLASHNVAGVQEAINRKGARLLYLPA
jgi:transposase